MYQILLIVSVLIGCVAQSAPSRLSKEWALTKQASTADEFRRLRRVGVGTSLGGVFGVAGVSLDLNFTEETSLGLGYGVGSPFRTFSIYVRRYMGTQTFSPYFASGYTRWFPESKYGQPISYTTPEILGDRFLSEDQKKSGKFQKNFLYPAIGIQYNQFSGPWAGLTLALELDFLIDLENLVTGSTSGLSCSYYF